MNKDIGQSEDFFLRRNCSNRMVEIKRARFGMSWKSRSYSAENRHSPRQKPFKRLAVGLFWLKLRTTDVVGDFFILI